MTHTIDELQKNLFQLQAVCAAAGVALDEGTPKEYKKKVCFNSLFEVVNNLILNALQAVENLQDEVESHVPSIPETFNFVQEERGGK